MRALSFMRRNIKEILRDPLAYALSLGIPICMLVFYQMMNAKTGGAMTSGYGYNFFALDYFVPGVAVFSFTFTMINTSMLVSKDRSSALLTRLYSSPMRGIDYIAGYAMPMVVIALGQALVCFAAAFVMGMRVNIAALAVGLAGALPGILLYVALGLLFGSLFSEKAAPGISSCVITMSTLAAGVWFDVMILGETPAKILHALPFASVTDVAKSALTLGGYGGAVKPLLISAAYIIALFALATFVFARRMKSDNN